MENYLNEIGTATLLTEQEERQLAERVSLRDEKAVSELVEKNLRLVVSIAKRYQGKGLEMGDLINEGNVGLMLAARKYTDGNRRFAVAATGAIRQQIERAIETWKADERNRNVAVEASPRAAKALSREDKPSAEERADYGFEQADIERRLQTLDAREQQVLKGVFGIGGDRLTMAEIGNQMGLKRERVRQIRDKALRKLRRAATLVLLLICVVGASAKSYTVASPDGRIAVEISDVSGLSLSVSFNGTPILPASPIGMTLTDGKTTKSLKGAKSRTLSEKIDAPFYRQSQFSMKCNETTMQLNDGFSLSVRVFNEGVAYRFATSRKSESRVKSETADYRFGSDRKCWLAYSTNEKQPFAMAFQNIYDETTIGSAKQQLVFLPATVDCGIAKVTLTESDLVSYPGMFLRSNGKGLEGVFAPYPKKMDYYSWRGMSYVKETEPFIARTIGARSYPWRVLAVSERDTEMPTNNMVYALARPNKIGSTKWIEPGLVAWDWWNDWMLRGVPFKSGINEQTYKYFIDFAANHGLKYVILDEGWYDSNKADVMNPLPELNLPELISYGKRRGVGIVLWSVFNVMDEHLEEVCRHYAEMGAAGFKIDFMDRDDQTAVEMVERLAACCAKNHLVLDLHGIYKPVGLNRTYPNILNYESVFGMEESRWTKLENDMPRYDVTFPFIRGMAGQVDFTPGALRNATKKQWQANYEKPMSMGTRAHQAACYIVQDSPFTMLADSPTDYEREEEFTKFIASLPTVFDETRCISGEIGQYIVIARRAGTRWYIGGQTNWDARKLTIPTDFLSGSHSATILRDGLNANHNAEDYLIERLTINGNSPLEISLASGGGFVLSIE